MRGGEMEEKRRIALEALEDGLSMHLVANPSLGAHLKHWWQQRRKR